MLSIYDCASFEGAAARTTDPQLHGLITRHWSSAQARGLAELTHIVVIQRGDDETTVEAEIGFNPLVSPLDGTRYGTSNFQPHWAWLQDVGGWYEMIVTVGNSGFAFILLIDKSDGALPELRQLCEEYVRCA